MTMHPRTSLFSARSAARTTCWYHSGKSSSRRGVMAVVSWGGCVMEWEKGGEATAPLAGRQATVHASPAARLGIRRTINPRPRISSVRGYHQRASVDDIRGLMKFEALDLSFVESQVERLGLREQWLVCQPKGQ